MSRHAMRLALFTGALLLILGLMAAPVLATGGVSSEAWLGALLYSDTALSQPDGQSCASCHTPGAGFADPDSDLPVSEGVLPFFGGRSSPSSAYAAWSPIRYFDGEAWVGGMFWDGRATGDGLGSPLADQARGPFLNPIEMNNASEAEVVEEVRTASYAGLFRQVYPGSLSDVDAAYDNVARAIAAYESSRLVNTFSSRFDAYAAGAHRVFTAQEKRGLALFNGKAQCSLCHPSTADATISTGLAKGKALFTDYTYDNLGIPQNPAIAPLTGSSAVDLGLGGQLGDPAYNGAFKVPTLRNVARTAPYGHNGYFATLGEIVHFYNTRDVSPWPVPEVPQNVNTSELGNLRLSKAQEQDVVAFLRTLTDLVVIPIPDL